MYLSALSQCSQQISLFFDYLLVSDDIGHRSDLRRQIDVGSNGPQASCDFVYFLEFCLDSFEVLSRAFVFLFERSWERSDCYAL